MMTARSLQVAILGLAALQCQAQFTISVVAGGPIKTGAAASASYIPEPFGIVADSLGRYYFSARDDNRVFRVNRSGLIDLVIGSGLPGFAGDGSSAASIGNAIALNLPEGLAVDGANNLYIADSGNQRVRKVDAVTSVITTVAGGSSGGGGLLGPPTPTGLSRPTGVAVDGSGNIYVADYGNSRVWKTISGTLTPFAGNGNEATSGDGGPAASAGVKPWALAFDSTGNLFIADPSPAGHRIRKVTLSTGVITTVAGNGSSNYSADNGPATSAGLPYPNSMAFDSSGSLYISAFGRIRKVTPAGVISTVAGKGDAGQYSGEGGLAVNAAFSFAGAVTFDPSGNLLYAAALDMRILKIDAVTNILTAAAGTGAGVGDNGPAAQSQLGVPGGVAVDGAGNIYIGDSGAGRIRKISAATGVITSIAGNGSHYYSGDGGLAINAGLQTLPYQPNLPIAVDAAGNVYSFDSNRIRRISVQTGLITTIAGGGSLTGSSADGGPATSANLPYVSDLIADSSAVYFSDGNIRKVDLTSGILTTVAGLNLTSFGLDRDSSGNFYYTNYGGLSVGKVTPGQTSGSLVVNTNPCTANCVNTALFTGAQLGDGGPAQAAALNYPTSVKVDRAGNLFIADYLDMRVRAVSAATGNIRTIGGTNAAGCSGSSGSGTSALTQQPYHLALGPNGEVYVADPKCAQIFKLTPTSSYAGWLDAANCNTISGWAADRARLGQSITVSIYDNATLLATITANQSRSDVGALLGDNGLHGFTYTPPASLRDGQLHTIHVYFETTGIESGNSPQISTCTASFVGFVDSSSCSGITGWAADRGRLNQSIVVSLWDGATQIASTTANGSRPDVGAALSDNGLHGFTLQIPAGYANGVSHALQVHFETSSSATLGGPVTLTCGGGVNYAGYVDSASCSGINGWIADRGRLNQSLLVTLWDGATQIASATANALRPDVGAILGDNGLHGFSLQLPASYANGVNHTLQVHYEATATPVTGAAISLTCSNGARYAGWLDRATCTDLSGWAADLNRLNQQISVDLVEGTTVLATVSASASRPDVGSAIGDGGLHGFTIPTPALLKNGVPRTIQLRFAGTAQSLGNSPQNLQCVGASPIP